MDLDLFRFHEKASSSLLQGRYKLEEEMGVLQITRSETENISLYHEFVHGGIFLLCS